jgi:hypothetical protein
MQTMSDRLSYYVLPDDPEAALNVLRAAAGLESPPPGGPVSPTDENSSAHPKTS